MAAVYFVVSGLYILLSDRLLSLVYSDPVALTRMQTYKGWVFIATTSLLLYFTLNQQLQKVIKESEIRRKAEQELQQLNYQLDQRVQERTLQLEAKNREMESFAYSVSHDLKAPLRGIAGYSRLLFEDYADKLDGEGRLFLANIQNSVGQMTQLIDDLLTYSRLEQRALHSIEVNLKRLTDTVVREFATELETKGAHITVSVPECTVSTNPDAVGLALRNLVDNALKYSNGTNPLVEIGLDHEGSVAILWVKDNGIGFDMKYHDKVFGIFERLHRFEDYPGTGIGLALVRRAMERLGGKAWAESTPKQGSIFYLAIPNEEGVINEDRI